MKYLLKISEKEFEVEVGEMREGRVHVVVNGKPYEVSFENFASVATHPAAPRPSMAALVQRPIPAPEKPVAHVHTARGETLIAPIPGLILDIKVAVGDSVIASQTVATMEAMKMENNLTCHVSGIVKEIRVQKGTEVATGDIIMIIEQTGNRPVHIE